MCGVPHLSHPIFSRPAPRGRRSHYFRSAGKGLRLQKVRCLRPHSLKVAQLRPIPNQLMPEPCFSCPHGPLLSVKMLLAVPPLNGVSKKKADILLSVLRRVEVGGLHGPCSLVIKASAASHLSALPLASVGFLLMVTRWLQLLRPFHPWSPISRVEERNTG